MEPQDLQMAIADPELARTMFERSWTGAVDFLVLGGPAIWAIAALAVLGLALILWKLFRFTLAGVWGGGRRTAAAVTLWNAGDSSGALALLARRRSPRAHLARAAMLARLDSDFDTDAAEAETARVARAELARMRSGMRSLELIATIGPLLGLLGTVTGMISAFQALQEAGARADPATLAGGIWEALLTTAAGMAVAIPVQIALTWFESIVDRIRHEMEDAATRIFLRAVPAAVPEAAPSATIVAAPRAAQAVPRSVPAR